MDRVPAALRARWLNDETRGQWITAALNDAKRRLEASDWTVRHAPGVAAPERAESFGGASLTWIEDGTLPAGLMIEKPGARMDASIDGLLAGSNELQSRVLRLLNEAMTA